MKLELMELAKQTLIQAEKEFRLTPSRSTEHGFCWFITVVLHCASDKDTDAVQNWFYLHYPVLNNYPFKFVNGLTQQSAWRFQTPGYKTERADWAKEMLQVHFKYTVEENHKQIREGKYKIPKSVVFSCKRIIERREK